MTSIMPALLLDVESRHLTKSPQPAAVPQVKKQWHLYIGQSGGGFRGFGKMEFFMKILIYF
jgi:hypothetical protein